MNKKLVSSRLIIVFSLFFIFTFFSTQNSSASDKTNKNKEYLSQVFVDTMVQNAYYNFIAASELSDGEFRQTQAITHAKNVARKLKKMAKGDPNRRYVFWRVGELEQQIYLEEEELELKRKYRAQKAINVLVTEFNPEIGKKRPNFSNLYAIHERMSFISHSKADELRWLIEDRNKNISRETSYFCEKAIRSGNFNRAQKEFSYIRNNRKYLIIPESKYEYFEDNMQAKQDADNLIKDMDKVLSEIQSLINGRDMQEAKYSIDFLHYRVKQMRSYISRNTYNDFVANIKELSSSVATREDSLVTENMQLVNAGRADAAIDFLDNVLRKYCIANHKIIFVDKAIMGMPGQDHNQTDNNVNQELTKFNNTSSSENYISFSDVEEKAIQKADSIRAYEGQLTDYERNQNQKKNNKAKVYTIKIYQLIEQNKIEKAFEKFEKHRDFLKKYSTHHDFSTLKNAIIRAQKDNKRTEMQKPKEHKNNLKLTVNQQKAQFVSKKILQLIENQQVEEAYKKFQQLRKPLQKYSSEDKFLSLEKTVTLAYNGSLKKK